MKLKNRLKYFTFLHILSLVIMGVVSTGLLYSKYERINPHKVFKILDNFQRTATYQIYMRYTGTETGFGFFAPNVRCNGFLMPSSCGRHSMVTFNTNEGNSRYGSLISTMTDDLFETKKTKKPNKLKDEYIDLIFKNIAAKIQSEYYLKDCGSFNLNYYVIQYPILENLSESSKNKPILLKIKSWTYAVK